MKTIQFKKWKCVAEYARYGNGRAAIELFDASDGTPVAMATVNLVDEDIPHGYAAIKDYAENEGMVQALKDAKIIEGAPVKMVQSGYVEIPVYKLV